MKTTLQDQLNYHIDSLDAAVMKAAQQRLDHLTKPQGSLGRLEEIARRMAGIQKRVLPLMGEKTVFVRRRKLFVAG